MLDELDYYKSNEHFFFKAGDDLEKVCNAPKEAIGVYVIYILKDGRVELVYIGSSGKVNQDGSINSEIVGLYDEIVNGIQFGKARKISWKKKLKEEKIDALDIYWYETFDQNHEHIPSFLASNILQNHLDFLGSLPKWNENF